MNLFKNIYINDRELLENIKEKIRCDFRASIHDININVIQGTVVVRGVVDSLYRKNAIIKIIQETDGVVTLNDHISVNGAFKRKDAELKNLALKQIEFLGLKKNEAILLKVQDSIITLKGIVCSSMKKAQISTLLWGISGVHDVINLLKIKSKMEDTISLYAINFLDIKNSNLDNSKNEAKLEIQARESYAESIRFIHKNFILFTGS